MTDLNGGKFIQDTVFLEQFPLLGGQSQNSPAHTGGVLSHTSRVRAMELLPNCIGLIGGLFYDRNFGLGGIAAALLGLLADRYGVEMVYTICCFLPLAGLFAWVLPKLEDKIA